MLSLPNVYVKNGYTELDCTARKRTISKKKRIRASEKKTEEKEYILLARSKQKEEEHKEFDRLKAIIQSGGIYDFSDLEAMVKRIREPFSCDVSGVNILVSLDDAAVIFDKTALGAMREVLVIGSKQNENNNDGPAPAKK
jgi:hypothetical protein